MAERLARLTTEWVTRDRFPAPSNFIFSYFLKYFFGGTPGGSGLGG
jgi:hypothetical protein